MYCGCIFETIKIPLLLLLLTTCCNGEDENSHVCAALSNNATMPECLAADFVADVKIPSHVPHPEFLSVYTFPRSPVMKVNCSDKNLLTRIQAQKPIILRNCTFFAKALKWDLAYLSQELTEEYAVSLSKSRKFLYYDTTKDHLSFKNSGWLPPYEVEYYTFKRFLEVASEFSSADNETHAYFQTLLLSDDKNSSVKDDLNRFDYFWLIQLAFELGWSTNVINNLFVGMPNVLTPVHYDMMENLFIQVKGKKRFILFSPDQFSCLYPYPVGHPHDRQSQVDFDYPDYQKFPKFRHVRALEAIIGPGDLLYVPTNWWHHVESNKNDFTVSLNFWFENQITGRMESIVKESASSQLAIRLTPAEDLAFKRHIESMVYNVTKNFTKAKEIFEDILWNRF